MLIGVTGNIGTGKSLFSYFLKKKNIPVYCSDNRGKIIMNNNFYVKKNIKKFFGINSYKNNKVNSNFLSKIIFNDKIALKYLCNVLYPYLQLDFKKWKINLNKNYPILIKESSLLFETDNYKEFDVIISLYSSNKNKIERVYKRNKLSKYQIISRLKHQFTLDRIKKYSNFIVENNSSIKSLKNKTNDIYKKLIKK